MSGLLKRLLGGAPAEFPDEWRGILRARLPFYSRLTDDERRQLEGHIQWFLEEKRFEGCGGQEITDELRVAIAGQACLLLLHQPRDGYEKLRTVIVYPSTYLAGNPGEKDLGARLGESWEHGTVVLAWDSALGGSSNPHDGHNVVLHEFAHQLDQEDGRSDGAPVLARGARYKQRRAAYASWARVLSTKYEQLQHKALNGQKTLLDKYGATNPAEFFAVATECFFEKPRQLSKKHPKLYDQLKTYYKQDPLNWMKVADGG